MQVTLRLPEEPCPLLVLMPDLPREPGVHAHTHAGKGQPSGCHHTQLVGSGSPDPSRPQSTLDHCSYKEHPRDTLEVVHASLSA